MSARHWASALLALAAYAAPALAADAAPAEPSAFHERERALSAGLADARQAASAQRALAEFYFDRRLCPEALAAIRASRPRDDDLQAQLLIAECEFALGRHERALVALANERLSADASALRLKAMAHAELGAFAAAMREFAAADRLAPAAEPLHRGHAAEPRHRLHAAEAALGVADAGAALRALGRPDAFDPASPYAGRAALVAASARPEGEAGAVRALQRLAAGRDERIAATAALRLLVMEAGRKRISPADALAQAQALGVRWSGGAFERERLAAIGKFARDAAPLVAIDALRRLAENHPSSDDAARAKSALGAMLGELLARSDISPETAARVFYENIAYAPPGRDGDAMIRAVAERLRRLDLLTEAAELLEHQTFARLRGAERSRLAADLAQVYLDDRRPGEALRVIRGTRLAGLDVGTAGRRRVIEATALDRTGDGAAALALLGEADDAAAMNLRADLAWRLKDWPLAAAVFRAVALSDGPIDADRRNAALRTGAAFLLAGDAAGFDAFRTDAKARFGALPEGAVLDALDPGDPGAVARFLDAYREVYGERPAG